MRHAFSCSEIRLSCCFSQGTQEVATVNGGEAVAMVNGEVDGCEVVAMVNGDAGKRWSFPPLLEDFDLMNSDMDPAELEQLFADDRWALFRPQ